VKSLLGAIVLSLAVCPAFAADKAEKREPSEKQMAQQERMKECNAKAADKKGDERKKFMSACLKGEASGKQSAQQEKMKTCNQQASSKKLKADERKQFMSSCLRGS
jgi:hypothetical protein